MFVEVSLGPQSATHTRTHTAGVGKIGHIMMKLLFGE